MRIYKFITTEQKEVIILEDVLIDNYKIRLIVDTCASKTIIDHNSLFMLRYTFGDFMDTQNLKQPVVRLKLNM